MSSARPRYLGTNLKMYKTNSETLRYLRELSEVTAQVDVGALRMFVIPSYTALADASRSMDHSRIMLGAQNMFWAEGGQYTGEVSPLMLRELGVDLVELGHSERRQVFGETDELINRKVLSALSHGFTALLCVGETLEERSGGGADAALERQLRLGLAGLTEEARGRLWVAYEPVWSIGKSGRAAEPDYVAERCAGIRALLGGLPGAGAETPILYGGSINLENAPGYLDLDGVDGLFVGRCAWEARRFGKLADMLLSH